MTGRWLTRDPIAENGGVNLYAFCNNDPVNGMDGLGLEIFKTECCGFFPYGYVPYFDSDAPLLSWDAWEHLLTGTVNIGVLVCNSFYGCLDGVGWIGEQVDNACVYVTGLDSAELYMNAAQAGPIGAVPAAIPYAVYRAGTGIRTGVAWITRGRQVSKTITTTEYFVLNGRLVPTSQAGAVGNLGRRIKLPPPTITPALQRQALANVTDSGVTVLGRYSDNYIGLARRMGASYFDMGQKWDPINGWRV